MQKALLLTCVVLIERARRDAGDPCDLANRGATVTMLHDDLDHGAVDAGALVSGDLGRRATRSRLEPAPSQTSDTKDWRRQIGSQ